jgi:hypothetical protein
MRDRASIRATIACVCALGWLPIAAGAGCSQASDSTGTLVVPFELGNRRTCSALAVKTVRAVLDDGMFSEEAPCSNGQVRFRDLPAGSYHVRLFGVDANGVSIMDSLHSGDVVVNVVGNDTTVVAQPAVTLTAAPAQLLLRWNFGFGTCKGVGVDRFAVKVWRSAGDDLLIDAAVPCESEGDGPDQYRKVTDSMRQLGGGEMGEITVQAVDKTGVKVGEPVQFRFDAPGPGRSIKLSLNCLEGACTGSGKPD